MGLNFNLNRRKDQETSIMMVYNFNGVKFKQSTGIKVKTKQWSFIKQRAKKSNGYQEALRINARLDKCMRVFFEALSNIEKSNDYITNYTIGREFNALLYGAPNNSNIADLGEYLKVFIQKKEKRVVSKGTIKSYRATIKHLKRWLENKSLEFSNVQTRDYESFMNYLYDKGLVDRTVIKHLKQFSAIVNFAIKDENTTAQINSFNLKELNLKVPESDQVYLTKDDLRLLQNHDCNDKREEKVRDAFLFLCFTGLRWGVMSRVGKENIYREEGEKPILQISINKGGEKVAIPLRKDAMTILEKYDFDLSYNHGNYFRPKVRELCKRVGINRRFNKRQFVKGVPQDNYRPTYEFVVPHTGRRTFITHGFEDGIPEAEMMKMTGHKDRDTIQIYNKKSALDTAKKLSSSPMFAG